MDEPSKASESAPPAAPDARSAPPAPCLVWAAWLREGLGEDVVTEAQPVSPGAKEGPREDFLRVRPTAIAEVLRFLRDDPRLRFDFLANLTAVDWPSRQALELVYHLVSYETRAELTVRCEVAREAPRLPSVVSVFPVADWHEREQYDLLGVVFEGHPELRRLLMPDDWMGFPLRKDYVEGKSYRGMPTTRPSPIDLLLHHDRERGLRTQPTVAGGKPAATAPAATTPTAPPAATPSKEPTS